MEKISDRLSWARRQAGFDTPQSAAAKFEWNVNTYKSHDNGTRPNPSQEDVDKYARAFGVDFVWLLTGKGSPTPRNMSTIAGLIGAGAEINSDIEAAYPEGCAIEVPMPVPPDTKSFEVKGESMWPRYGEGDVLVCGRELTNAEEIIGKEVALETLDGRRYVKRVRHGSKSGLFNLESHNAEPILDVKIKWAAKILAVVRKDEWRLFDPVAQRRLKARKPGIRG